MIPRASSPKQIMQHPVRIKLKKKKKIMVVQELIVDYQNTIRKPNQGFLTKKRAVNLS